MLLAQTGWSSKRWLMISLWMALQLRAPSPTSLSLMRLAKGAALRAVIVALAVVAAVMIAAAGLAVIVVAVAAVMIAVDAADTAMTAAKS